MTAHPHVAIVGAGPAGLACAYKLQQRGISTAVFEQGEAPGGRTRSIHQQGYTFDLGAATLASSYHQTLALLKEVGADHLLSPGCSTIGLVRDGTLHELDLKQPAKAALSPALSLSAKLRLLGLAPELARAWRLSGFDGMARLAKFDSESCQQFVSRRCGKEILDYLADPLIRLNMFTSAKVSSRVDLLWLMRIFSSADIIQVEGGMGAICQAIAKSLNIQYHSAVESVRQDGNQVTLTVAGSQQRFDACVVAVPAPQAAALTQQTHSPQWQWLQSREPVTSVSVHLGLAQQPDSRAGFCLMPSCESEDVVAFIYDHNKAADRAPANKGLLCIHLSADWASRHRHLSDEAVAHLAARTLSARLPSHLNVSPEDIETFHVHYWDYVDHHRPAGTYQALAQVADHFSEGPIKFAGEFISAGIEGAIISGQRCAEQVIRDLAI